MFYMHTVLVMNIAVFVLYIYCSEAAQDINIVSDVSLKFS